MNLMDKVNITEKVFLTFAAFLIVSLIVCLFLDNVPKWIVKGEFILLILFFVVALSFKRADVQLEDYRESFIAEQVFPEEEILGSEKIVRDDPDYVGYEIKTKDALVYMDVDYGMKDDGSFDYYIKDVYQRGEK